MELLKTLKISQVIEMLLLFVVGLGSFILMSWLRLGVIWTMKLWTPRLR